MPLFDPSPTLVLVWESACQEVQNAGLAEISPDHFFALMCRLTSSPTSLMMVSEQEQPALHAVLPTIREELAQLTVALEALGLDQVARQAVAEELLLALGKGSVPYAVKRSRSLTLKALCEQAARRALSEGHVKTRPTDLLPLLLITPEGKRGKLLADRGISPHA